MSDMVNMVKVGEQWGQRLGRRVMRLLLQYDAPLFRSQFRVFMAGSGLPGIALLEQYDQYIKLQFLARELLDDIVPRIRRQLAFRSVHTRQLEVAPTRGVVDWTRTVERGWMNAPGQVPLELATTVRQRSAEIPENILTIALLGVLQGDIQYALAHTFADEDFSVQEKHFLHSTDHQLTRELATAHARALIPLAQKAQLSQLVREVSRGLKPGPTPYRDLIDWWQRYEQFRVANRAQHTASMALASKRQDEKSDAWLYELWIMLELLHVLHDSKSIAPQDIQVATNRLSYCFEWGGRRLRLIYNRQLDTASDFVSGWEHAPASRPDYTLEREQPLVVRHQGRLIWREPSVVFDAKYYMSENDTAHTHKPIKKLLGDMLLLGAEVGGLFFPRIAEPTVGGQVTAVIRHDDVQYSAQRRTPQISLYKLAPDMDVGELQARLRAVLDEGARHLTERPQPVCLRRMVPGMAGMAMCPKPHIGLDIFDVVDVERDCWKNARVCHVM